MLLTTMFGLHPFLKKLFADAAYQGPQFHNNLASVLPHLETEIVRRSDQAKAFVVLPKRWIVERTIAWLKPLIPPGKTGGGKRRVIMREVVNGLMYILSTGCQWRAIPKDLPPKSSVYDYFDLWTYDGTLERIHHALYEQCREREQRQASPTAAIIDSQSVKSAEKGGPALIRTATMRARKSRARSGTFLSIR